MNFNKTDFNNDLTKATAMGASAFKRACGSPAADVEFSYFIKKYSTSEKSKKLTKTHFEVCLESSTIIQKSKISWKFTKQLLKLMDAWQRGWTVENLK